MKKIAFFVQHMLCGGVENALLSLTTELANRGNKVTIYVIDKKGDFISKIPENVELRQIPIPEKILEVFPRGGSKIAIREKLREHHFLEAVIMLGNHFFGKSGFAELNVDFHKIPDLDEAYDIAVDFHMHSPFLVRYVAEKVTADKKYAWIHNDFTTTGYDIKKLEVYLENFDLFFAVSQKLLDEFISIFPEYAAKSRLALNIVPKQRIREQAEEFFPEEFARVPSDCLKILSVGRLEYQKGYDYAIDVCKKLKEKNMRFVWFVLGDGTERQKLEEKIREYGLGSCFIFLGIRMNPYPYFKNCDIYVQTSRHEGWGITITEAKAFNLPIVCTDFAGAREQLVDGISGDISEIQSESIFEKLQRLVQEPERRKLYSENLAKNNAEVEYSYLRYFE